MMDYWDWGFYIKNFLLPTTCRFFLFEFFFPFWRMLWTNSIGSFCKENIFTENSETRLSLLKTRHSYIKSNTWKKSLTNPFWCKYPVWKNKSTKKKVIWFFGKITLAHMVFKFHQTEAKSFHFPPFCKELAKKIFRQNRLTHTYPIK